MRRPPVSILAAGVVLLVGGAVAVAAVRTIRSSHSLAATGATVGTPALVVPSEPASPLEFRELFDPGPALEPSAKALALDGKRVRIIGFMAEMEEPIEGAFYLVPRPIRMDESGGGTGDLPLESVLVAIPGSEGKPLPHVGGPLEGTGVLEVGNRADEHGRVSNFRLRLDQDQLPGAGAGWPRPTATNAAAATTSTH
jgi:hypothetical protein